MAIAWAGLIMLGIGLALDYHTQGNPNLWKSIKDPATLAQLRSFIAAKEEQANAAGKTDGRGMPPEYQTFFKAVDKGDWLTVSNIFWEMGWHNGGLEGGPSNVDMTFRGIRWEAVREIWGAFAAFDDGDEKYSRKFGDEIIQSIPPGSIYFGGTDPGRFIVTAMQKSQIHGEPFFTLTQNALTDGSYLHYLRSMYGNKIYLPAPQEVAKCFDDFYADIQKRFKKNQLNPGEEVTVNSNGILEVSGKVAVMEISAVIAKTIFDRNTNREFYIEEDVPLDWMYPYLEPHGLIFKLNHEPLNELPQDVVQEDHDYWTNTVSPMIGNWLTDDTSVAAVAAFVEKVFVRHDLSGFKGDPTFIKNLYAHCSFAKERDSIGGLYAWRAQNSNNKSEKEQMNREADFAFRQAWAMCPNSPEAIFRYVNLLMDENRVSDALLVAETSAKLTYFGWGYDPKQIQDLVTQLKQRQKQSEEWMQFTNKMAVMETEARIHPSNYTNIFVLAGMYLEMQQTNRGVQLISQTMSRKDADFVALYWASQFFAKLDDYTNLETALTKLTIMEPNLPEPMYDLSRLDVVLGRKEEAIKHLRVAIDLSDQCLKTDPKALNIREMARTNTADFKAIRDWPEFRKLFAP